MCRYRCRRYPTNTGHAHDGCCVEFGDNHVPLSLPFYRYLYRFAVVVHQRHHRRNRSNIGSFKPLKLEG